MSPGTTVAARVSRFTSMTQSSRPESQPLWLPASGSRRRSPLPAPPPPPPPFWLSGLLQSQEARQRIGRASPLAPDATTREHAISFTNSPAKTAVVGRNGVYATPPLPASPDDGTEWAEEATPSPCAVTTRVRSTDPAFSRTVATRIAARRTGSDTHDAEVAGRSSSPLPLLARLSAELWGWPLGRGSGDIEHLAATAADRRAAEPRDAAKRDVIRLVVSGGVVTVGYRRCSSTCVMLFKC